MSVGVSWLDWGLVGKEGEGAVGSGAMVPGSLSSCGWTVFTSGYRDAASSAICSFSANSDFFESCVRE